MASRKTAVEATVLRACGIVAGLGVQSIRNRIVELHYFRVFPCDKCGEVTVGAGSFSRHYYECVRGSHEDSVDIPSVCDYETAYTIFHYLVVAELNTTSQLPQEVTSVFLRVVLELEMMRHRNKLFGCPRCADMEYKRIVGSTTKRRNSSIKLGKEMGEAATKRRKSNSEASTLTDDVTNDGVTSRPRVETNQEASVSDPDDVPEGQYKVEAILDSRRKTNPETRRMTKHYLVKWLGYEESENTWEPVENLKGCLEIVAAFEEQRKKSKSPSRRSAKSSPSSTRSFLNNSAKRTAVVSSLNGRRGRRSRQSLEMSAGSAINVPDILKVQPPPVIKFKFTQQVQDATDFLDNSNLLHETQVAESEEVLPKSIYITPSTDEHASQPDISSTSVRILPYPDVDLPSYAVEVSASFTSDDGLSEAREECHQVAQINAESNEQETDVSAQVPRQNGLGRKGKTDIEVSKNNVASKRITSRMNTGGMRKGNRQKKTVVIESGQVRKETKRKNKQLRKRRDETEELEVEFNFNEKAKKEGEEQSEQNGRTQGGNSDERILENGGNEGGELGTRVVEVYTGQDGCNIAVNGTLRAEVGEESVGEHFNPSQENLVAMEERRMSYEELVPREDVTEGETPSSLEDASGEKEDIPKDSKSREGNGDILDPEGSVSLRTEGTVTDGPASQVEMSLEAENGRQVDQQKADEQRDVENGYIFYYTVSLDFEPEGNNVSSTGMDDKASSEERVLLKETLPNSQGVDTPKEAPLIEDIIVNGQAKEDVEPTRNEEALEVEATEFRNKEAFVEDKVLVAEGRSSSSDDSGQIQNEKMDSKRSNEDSCTTEDSIGLGFEKESACNLGSYAEAGQTLAEEQDPATQEKNTRRNDVGRSKSEESNNKEMEVIRENGHAEEREISVRGNASTSDGNVAIVLQGRQLLSTDNICGSEVSAEEVILTPNGATLTTEMGKCSDSDGEDEVLLIDISQDDVDVLFRSAPVLGPEPAELHPKARTSVKGQPSATTTRYGVSDGEKTKRLSAMTETPVGATWVVMPTESTSVKIRKVTFADQELGRQIPKVPAKRASLPSVGPQCPVSTKPELPRRIIDYKNFTISARLAESLMGSERKRISVPACRAVDSLSVPESRDKEANNSREREPTQQFTGSCCNGASTMSSRTLSPERGLSASLTPLVKPKAKNAQSKVNNRKLETQGKPRAAKKTGMPGKIKRAKVDMKGKSLAPLADGATGSSLKASAGLVSGKQETGLVQSESSRGKVTKLSNEVLKVK